jgi:hypothetical protein
VLSGHGQAAFHSRLSDQGLFRHALVEFQHRAGEIRTIK